MARTRLLYRPDHPEANARGMVDADLVYGYEPGAAPNVITDTMEPTRHMANGRYYDSKSKFRAVTKAHGCVEVGNETATMLKERKPVELDRRQRREDIHKAIYQLKNGMVSRD
jgi:hypothetical protein